MAKKYVENIESYLNSLGLTKNEPIEGSDLTHINTLLENNIKYFSVGMTTTANNHATSAIIDLDKIKNNEKNFIYTYDATRVIDVPKQAKVVFGDLGGLQEDCQIFNNFQQRLGSCWFHASCFTIAAAEHPEIFEEIKEKKIKPISFEKNIFTKFKQLLRIKTKFNDVEKLQMATLQKVSEDFGVEKFGKTKKRMTHQIIDKPTRNALKKEAETIINNSELLKNLEFKLGTTMALSIINEKNELLKNTSKKTEEIDKKLLERYKKVKDRNKSDSLLNKVNKEIESLGPLTKMELLKGVKKAETKEEIKI